MWEIPECISYSELRKNEGLLLIGDSKGSITSFHFKQTNKSFFKIIPNKNTNDTYFWQDIVDEPDWVEISKERNIHKDIIMQLEYIKRSDCIISCSLDRQLSVAIRQRKANRAPYIFSVDKVIVS
ncbi:hypothetical protein O3M35_009008 [Rhynocoris fuscipes]|uniref:Uncharacterized protein n=1 Tax=Rhynocoris fuscipes TaxID=488301 RepID=A0AAW1D6S4_9HEMI